MTTPTYTVDGRDYAGPQDLEALSSRELVALYNSLRPALYVVRFESRALGIERTWNLIRLKVQPNDMPECIQPGVKATVKKIKALAKKVVDTKATNALVQHFEAATNRTLNLEDLSLLLGVTPQQVRGRIDAARTQGARIESCGRGSKAWRLVVEA